MHLDRKTTLLKKSLPLMACELADALVLFSGVLFLTLEDEVYLAAIGLIDAFLLCAMAYGFALSDAYQNFFARRRAQQAADAISVGVHKASRTEFAKSALAVMAIGGLLLWAGQLVSQTEIVGVLVASSPFLIPVILVYYVGLSFHSFLTGKGHLQRVGYAALLGFFMHLALLFIFHHFPLSGVLPTSSVLLATLGGEVFWALILWVSYMRFGYGHPKAAAPFKHRTLEKVLRKAAITPAISMMSFHLATFTLFLYLAWCCAHAEVATLTLAMSYYALLIAPVNGISAAAANGFSLLHTTNRTALFPRFRKKVLTSSFAVVATVFLLFAAVQMAGFHTDGFSLQIMGFVGLLAMVAMCNKLDFVALLVRLKLGLYLRFQCFYALFVAVGFVVVQWLFPVGIMGLLLVIMMAQTGMALVMRRQVFLVW